MTVSNKRSILIVDDDKTLCSVLEDHLAGERFDVRASHTGASALDMCRDNRIDLVLLDQKLPDAMGHDLCASLLGFNEQAKIIFMTAYPSFDNALKAIKSGAYDYLSKPFELEELDLIIKRALRTLDLEGVEQFQGYQDHRESEKTVLIGSSEVFREIRQMVGLSAGSDAAVLVTGETGTGKNIVARAIHYGGASKGKPFVSLNCAALPENLIEAELFGHEKGAFTGALEARKGIFEMAEGGTIFLDEIGEIPIHLQSKLLSVLDDKVVRRLGGRSERPVNVRIIAATNINLQLAIEEKRFREDLFYRLSVIRLHIPPLRERKDDIPELCDFLMRGMRGGRESAISDSEMPALMSYDWPGNVRELRNVIERAIILGRGNVIKPSELLKDSRSSTGQRPEQSAAGLSDTPGVETLREVERRHIHYALGELSGNYSRTARALGVSLSTLKRKMKEYGLR